jgi:hypothetical protein
MDTRKADNQTVKRRLRITYATRKPPFVWIPPGFADRWAMFALARSFPILRPVVYPQNLDQLISGAKDDYIRQASQD